MIQLITTLLIYVLLSKYLKKLTNDKFINFNKPPLICDEMLCI